MIQTVGRVELDPASKVPIGVHCADELAARGASSITSAVVKGITPSGPVAAGPFCSGTDLMAVLSGLRLGQTYVVSWHYVDSLGWEDDVSLEVACVDL